MKYVVGLTFSVELASGPRTRMSFVSEGWCPMVMYGRTYTVGVAVEVSIYPEPGRSISTAIKAALVEAKVGVMVGWFAGSNTTVSAYVVGVALVAASRTAHPDPLTGAPKVQATATLPFLSAIAAVV